MSNNYDQLMQPIGLKISELEHTDKINDIDLIPVSIQSDDGSYVSKAIEYQYLIDKKKPYIDDPIDIDVMADDAISIFKDGNKQKLNVDYIKLANIIEFILAHRNDNELLSHIFGSQNCK